MNKKVKELEQRILNMAKEFDHNHYKENAWKEYDKIRETYSLDETKNICFIIDRYPDFDNIELKLEEKGKFIFRVNIEPNFLLENPIVARKVAKMFSLYVKKGAVEE